MKFIENRKNKNIILLSILTFFIVIYRLFIYKNLLKYSESICASFSVILLSLSIFFLGFRKSNNTELKSRFLKTTIISLVLYFVGTYGLGIAVGFLSNSYSLNPVTMINNSFYILIMIVATELCRYVFITSNKDDKISIVFFTILIALFEINMFIKYDSFIDSSNIFKFLTLTVLPIIMKHILCSYSTYYSDYKASMVYRLIMELYIYFVPIQPDLGDYLSSVLTLFLPFVILLYLTRIIENKKNKPEKDFSNKIIKLTDIPVIALLVLLTFVVLGIGPYKLVGIETGSMSPSIRIGDAVVINKNIDKNELKENDVIAYTNKENVLIIHRIIKINSDGTYVTKGDYNNTADSGFINKNQIQGKVAFKIPYIAYPAIIFKQK